MICSGSFALKLDHIVTFFEKTFCLGECEMQHLKNALPKDAELTYYKFRSRSRISNDMSTSTIENLSGSTLSTGAIIGIVVGSVCGVAVLIGVVFLVRQFFCRFPNLQSSTDKSTVSYIRSNLNVSTLDRTASSSVDLDSSRIAHHGGDGEITPVPSFKGLDKSLNTPDGTESCNAIEINFPASGDCLIQRKRNDSSPSKSSETGTDNPCFESDGNKLSSLSMTTPTKTLTVPAVAVNGQNSNSLTSSDSKLNVSYMQERSNQIRRSYHLDRSVALAIAAQRNREVTVPATIFNVAEFPPNGSDDVVIVFTARTVL